MRQNDDGKTVAATDLMVPGIGELVGASQREERYDVLRDRMLELGGGPVLVPGPAPLRYYGPLRLWHWLRSPGDVPHRNQQHSGRAAIPSHHRRCRVLS